MYQVCNGSLRVYGVINETLVLWRINFLLQTKHVVSSALTGGPQLLGY